MNDQTDYDYDKYGPVACRLRLDAPPPCTTYEVDPVLAQGLHAMMRARGIFPSPRSHHKKRDYGSQRESMRNTARKRHKKLLAARAKKLPQAEMERCHVEDYQGKGISVEHLCSRYNVAKSTLAERWKELGLPISISKELRYWRPDE